VQGRAAVTRTLKQFRAAWLAYLLRAFSTGGHAHHGGAQWAPRKVATGPILGGQVGSLAQATSVELTGDTSLSAKNTSDIAAYHHFGTDDIDARPLVVLTRADIEQAKMMLKRNVEAALNRGI
jgi:hypothetical protein